jgi:hypothetical protein
MCDVIDFQTRKKAVLSGAVASAEAAVGKNHAEMDWLRRTGASVAEQVRASLRVSQALAEVRKCEVALARFCGVTSEFETETA